VAIVVCLGVLAGPSAASFADEDASYANNVVSVSNTIDGALRARSRAVATHAPGSTVTNENVAIAQATCTGCRTVAAAVQILIVEGQPTDFEPGNGAAAVNTNCHACETFAYARQVVFTPGRRVWLSEDAQERIEGVNEQIAHVVRSPEGFGAMTADLDRLTAQLSGIVRAEIQRNGTSAGEDDHRDVREDHHDD